MATTKKWSEIRRTVHDDPVRAARVDEYLRGMEDAIALGQLRERRERSQSEIARALGQSQPNVSRIERQDDLYISTLEEYVAALGGRLELRAVFPDDVVTLERPSVARAAGAGGQELLEVRSGDLTFRTVPDQPGFVDILGPDGRWANESSRGAVAWLGTPIVELEIDEEGVIVRTEKHEGRIAKNARGSWCLVEATERAAAPRRRARR